jgi:hypothetical protein
MHRTPLSQLRPNAIELWYVVFFSCALILIGNGKLILERAGLITSADLIGQQVSTKVLWGTNWLDNFQFTAGVINLIVWGGIGLIIYSTLQSVVRSLRIIAYERDFDSQLYVHPQGYTHQAYWKQIVMDAVLGFFLMAVFVICAIGYVFIVLPDGFVYVQHFILTPNIRTTVDPLIGLDIACVSTLIMYMMLKLVIRHHRVAASEL